MQIKAKSLCQFFKSLTIINENRNINEHKHSVIQNIVSSKLWGAKGMGGKRHGGQKTGGQKTGGQKAWGAKGRGAKGRGAKDRGAKDRGAKDRGAKVLSPPPRHIPPGHNVIPPGTYIPCDVIPPRQISFSPFTSFNMSYIFRKYNKECQKRRKEMFFLVIVLIND